MTGVASVPLMATAGFVTRRITIRFGLVLSLLAALAIMEFIINRGNTDTMRTDAAVLNVSGRERMLSQSSLLQAQTR